MQLMLNAIFKALKILANKNNDKNAFLRTNTFNLLNKIFYFNTIVKIITYHIIYHIKVTQNLNKYAISLKSSN